MFGALKVVDDLFFSIKKHEILTILGHNGAGKTTFTHMLCGLLTPSSGCAIIYGSSINTDIDQV